MERWLLSFLIGALSSLSLPIVPSKHYVILLIGVAMIFVVINKTRAISGFFFGFAWLLFHGSIYQNIWHNNDISKEKIAYQKVIVTGQVSSFPSTSLPPTKLPANVSRDKKNGDYITEKNQTEINKFSKGNSKDTRFEFLINSIDGQTLNQPIKARLNWRGGSKKVALNQNWQLRVRIKPAHGYANLGGFSYSSWLRQKGIHATGYVISERKKENQNNKKENKNRKKETGIKEPPINLLFDAGVSIRQKLIDRMDRVQIAALDNNRKTGSAAAASELEFETDDKKNSILRNSSLSSIIFALCFGERSRLTKNQWTVLTATGTQHLIAISGLHIGLVAVGFFYLAGAMLKYLPLSLFLSNENQQRLNAENHIVISLFMSLFAASFYAYLAGFSLPTQRALIMLIIIISARLFTVNLRPSSLLLLCVFFIIVFEPFSVFSASFWLSLYAVSVIFLIIWRFGFLLNKPKGIREVNASERNSHTKLVGLQIAFKIRQFLLSLIAIQVGLSLCMLPIVAFTAGEISVLAFVANLIVVPLMSFICIPLCLLALITMFLPLDYAVYFYQLAVNALEFPWTYLAWVASWQGSLVDLSNKQWLLLCIVIVSISLCFFLGFSLFKNLSQLNNNSTNMRSLGRLSFVLGSLWLCSSFRVAQSNDWLVHVLDVGQGLAVVIEKDRRFVLYDTGAKYPSGFSLASAVILPYLRYRGVKKLDILILSHEDNDHAGGLQELVENIEIERIIFNKPSGEFDKCHPENSFRWQSLAFTILSPAANLEKVSAKGESRGKLSSNDSSCVIRVSDNNNSVLLTGDISHKIEKKLFNHNEKVQSDILIVPHHGSVSSSSTEFLVEVKPKLALVSAGYLNRWKMPRDKVRKRYRDESIPLMETAKYGTISIHFTDSSSQVKSFRNNDWPYWFAQ